MPLRRPPTSTAEATVRPLGWEVAERLERDRPTILDRLRPGRREVSAALWGVLAFFALFLIGAWLAGNPFEHTQRVASDAVVARGWLGTDTWAVLWWVVAIAVVLEFLDASAGMGYGTAITPLLLIMGFDPVQIVPAVMIQQAAAGLLGAFLHREFGNVEWRWRPPSETVRLAFLIAGMGGLAVAVSATAVYGLLQVGKTWIQLYVALLLLAMGAVSVANRRRGRPYRPRRMILFGALAGFNKGIGGGGYGPVVTVGGVLAGVPIKSMMAVTALSEGIVCIISVGVWFLMLQQGVVVDFLLLPSMLLGSMIAAVGAPYATRVLPSRLWRVVVPVYCCALAGYALYKVAPAVIASFAG